MHCASSLVLDHAYLKQLRCCIALLTGMALTVIAPDAFSTPTPSSPEIQPTLSVNIASDTSVNPTTPTANTTSAPPCDPKTYPSTAECNGSAYPKFQEKIFVKIDTLQCNSSDIVITTACVDQRDDEPYCFSQNIAFLKKAEVQIDGIDRDIIKNIHYTQPWRDGNTPFISNAACIKKNKRHYVRLYSTNFGLCRNGCEWSDFFTAQGKYLGSTGGHRGMISFPLRYIGYPLYDHILSGDWIEQADDQSSIHINRVRKYTEE